MKLGIDLDGRISLSDMVDMCRIADEAGFHSIWADQHLGYRDAVSSSIAFLAETKKTLVIPTALSPYVAHPLFWAMGIATLAEYAPGRTALCAGTANAQVIGEMGIPFKKPLAHMRDMICSIRQVWEAKRERVEFTGETLSLKGAHIDFEIPGSSIPIYLAAIGEKMCRLAGEVSDGVVFSAAVSPQYIEWAIEQTEIGRKRSENNGGNFTYASLIMASISEIYEDALLEAQKGLGYLLRNPGLRTNLELTGVNLDIDAVNNALVKKDWTTMSRLLPEKIVHAFTVTGTPKMAIDRISEYLKTGLEIPILALRGSPESRKHALRLLAEQWNHDKGAPT